MLFPSITSSDFKPFPSVYRQIILAQDLSLRQNNNFKAKFQMDNNPPDKRKHQVIVDRYITFPFVCQQENHVLWRSKRIRGELYLSKKSQLQGRSQVRAKFQQKLVQWQVHWRNYEKGKQTLWTLHQQGSRFKAYMVSHSHKRYSFQIAEIRIQHHLSRRAQRNATEAINTKIWSSLLKINSDVLPLWTKIIHSNILEYFYQQQACISHTALTTMREHTEPHHTIHNTAQQHQLTYQKITHQQHIQHLIA